MKAKNGQEVLDRSSAICKICKVPLVYRTDSFENGADGGREHDPNDKCEEEDKDEVEDLEGLHGTDSNSCLTTTNVQTEVIDDARLEDQGTNSTSIPGIEQQQTLTRKQGKPYEH
ncbi:uncharacterized protein LOC127843203 [Dreissena polymorpha]|uniref:uncharacterized protein LOC127843203 n=1 Tax=Dreissena polymorpha TaxID=45954 RepID=UPI00226494FA|nr:uncharacterized protein LOC127843203 [Dreissena polymorpha]